ncbi:MAG: hypothetical protein ACKORK_03565, partial [Gemmatimonadota bacterium]
LQRATHFSALAFSTTSSIPPAMKKACSGKYVKLEETISSIERLVAGEFDHLPEQAFFMAGGIEDVVENAKALK